MSELDPAAIMAAHRPVGTDHYCVECDWSDVRGPCLPYRLAVELVTACEQLAKPCGSCHPCTQWANQTWVNAGERLPSVVEWQDMRDSLAEFDRCFRSNSRAARRMLDFIGRDEPEVVSAKTAIDGDPYADDIDFGSIVIAYVTRLRADVEYLVAAHDAVVAERNQARAEVESLRKMSQDPSWLRAKLRHVPPAPDLINSYLRHFVIEHSSDVNDAGTLYTCEACGWGWRTRDETDAQQRWKRAHTAEPETGDTQ